MLSIELTDEGFAPYDSEVRAIASKILPYINAKQNTRMDLENFRRTLEGKFAEIGLVAVVSAKSDPDEPEVFGFSIELRGRIDRHEFDFDQQVHEVTRNLLDDPQAATGFINTRNAMAELRHANPDVGKPHTCG